MLPRPIHPVVPAKTRTQKCRCDRTCPKGSVPGFRTEAGSHGSEGYGLEGAGDQAALRGFREQAPQDIVGLGEYPILEATLQVVVESQEAPRAEAAGGHPLEKYLGPLQEGQMGTGLGTGDGVGHVIAKVQGQGPEAVHLELGGIFSAEGVHLSPELGKSHCFTSSRNCLNRGDVLSGSDVWTQ